MILVSDVVERVVLIVVNVLLKCLVAVVEVSRQLVFFLPLTGYLFVLSLQGKPAAVAESLYLVQVRK